MKFKMAHNNINVFDLGKSLEFYNKALGLKEKSRITSDDGEFIIVFLTDEQSKYLLELTWLKERKVPYNLGDNEIHLAFTTDQYEKALGFHKENDWVCFENEQMGIYFISDPDGYWIEIIPEK